MHRHSGAGSSEPPAILIAGPTASGKSALAARLAERLGGAVVNADSMQVYRELEVLTARPGPEETARVLHHLYGHVPACRAYSVAAWLRDVEGLLNEARADHRPLVIVGGTGLYFKALVEGLSPVPVVPAAVRADWRTRAATVQPAELHRALAERDPVMAARLRPSDPQRIVRALEVIDATGRSLAEWQAGDRRPLLSPDATAHRFILAPDREDLRRRIADRFQAMVTAGALKEAAAIAEAQLEPTLPALKALGLAPLLDHLAGQSSLEAAIDRAITDSRQYAKRQETFFRNQMPDWDRLTPGAAPAILDRL